MVLGLNACQLFEPRGFFVSYETVDERFEQSMSWNILYPYPQLNSSGDSYDMYAISDTHVGGTNNLNMFFEQALQNKPLAVFMAGDLTTGHAEDYLRLQSVIPPWDTLPAFLLPGNHDLYFDGWKQFYHLFGASVYSFSVKTPQASDLYICLDNAGGTIGKLQLEWLRQTLQNERSLYRYCVLVNHNNWFRIRRMVATNPYVEELDILIDLCLKHHVDVVISGHDHVRHSVFFGNTLHLTLDALTDTYPSPGYLVLNIQPDSINFTFRHL